MRFLFLLAAIAVSCCASLAFGQSLPARSSDPSFQTPAFAAPSMFCEFGREQPSDALAPESLILPVGWLQPAGQSQPADVLPSAASFSPGPVYSGPVSSGTAPTGYGAAPMMGLFTGRTATSNMQRASCDVCPTHAMTVFVGYDAWRGVAGDSWENNGIHTGLNYGTRLGQFSDLTGVGFQIGGSVGVYNWSGTDSEYVPSNNNPTTQGFLTFGFFRKQTADSNWSAALVQDWMFTNNYGAFFQNPTMSQWRGQLGYATSAWNEYGVWGAFRCTTANANISGVGPTSWRSLDQLDAFWHHKWQQGGGDTWLYVGAPLGPRLTGDGSLGTYIASAAANVPLSNRVALYTLVTYMRPSDHPSSSASSEEAWNFTIGLSYYPRSNARSNTVAGQCWMPQMPVANNGYFLVDTNHH